MMTGSRYSRRRRSIGLLLAAVIYVQPLAETTFAIVPTPRAAAQLLRLPAMQYAPALPAPTPEAADAIAAPKGTEAPKAPELSSSVDQTPTAAVDPILECVVLLGEGRYQAYFGYRNYNSVAVSIPAGLRNKFLLPPIDRGQPTTFEPGRSPAFPNAAFSTTLWLFPYIWAVENGGHLRLAAATLFSPRCAPQPAPSITISSPAVNGSVTGPSVTVTGTVSGGTPPTTVTVNGVSATRSGNSFSATLSNVPNGQFSITAAIRDIENRTSTATRSITVGATAPTIALTSPINGTIVRNPIAVAGTVSGTSPITVDVNGAAATVTGNTFSASISPPDGPFAVTATAHGPGNTTAVATAGVTVDSTPPEIVIVDPAAGQHTNAQAIEVRGGVVEPNAATVTVDGIPATITNGEFVAAGVPVGSGPEQIISVVATDAAGNATTKTVTINIDRVAPALSLTLPAADDVLEGPRIAVSGTVADANTVYVSANDEPITVNSDGTFTGEVPLGEGARALTVVAHDLAGNETRVVRSIVVDSEPPTIVIDPETATLTNTSPLLVRGSVTDATSVVVSAGGLEVTPDANGVFTMMLPLHAQGSNTLIVTATDAAENESTAAVTVVFDSVAPVVSFTSPGAGATVPSLPVTIQGAVQELISGATVKVNGTAVTVDGATWSYVLDDLDDGVTTVTVEATDGAGNSSPTVTRSLLIDVNAPEIQIATPESGTLTAAGSITVTGTVQDVSLATLTVNGIPATLDPPAAGPRGFTATIDLADGDNTIMVSATDAVENRPPATAQVMVTRDSTPPTIALTADPKASQLRPAAVDIQAADNLVLASVTVSVNGSLVQTFTAPPYVINIAAPAASRGGDTMAVVAEAIDSLGNRAQATASISVISDGAVVGQVLTDVDGKPLQGAIVAVDGGTPLESDAQGRYTFAAPGTQVSLSISSPDTTTVDRALAIGSESGTSVVDARLTKLAAATAVGAADTTLTAGALAVQIPAGAFADGSSVRVTSLSGQGLPGLLPLGWSPVAALDLRGPAPASAVMLRLSNAGTQPMYLARYVNRSWHLASGALTPDVGVVTIALPIADAISVALVVPDSGDGAPAVPAIGEALPGVDAVAIPFTATSAGVLDPPVLSPGGGTSIGTLTVTSPTPLPSGTVVQAVMTETFTLASGDTVSTDARSQDFILYRAPAGLVAAFPVVPSRSFDAANLVQGVVHLDILAGRESVRGSAGGSSSVTLTADGATLSVAQGALTTGDVPITFQSAVLSSFLPATADVSPLREFSVDFSGRILEIGAGLSVLATQLTGVGVDDAVVIARVDPIEGVSRLVTVAIGELVGDRYHARALQGLPGITRGGRHVWYRVAGGVGFVRGVIDVNGTVLPAMVEITGLPFVSMANSNGQYAAVGRIGAATVRARAPATSLAGEAPADIALNAESTANISLSGTVSTAAIAPANAAINVSITAQVEIASPVSINPQSLATADIQFQRTSEPAGAVPYRVVLSGSGRTLAIVPLARLAEGAMYAVTVTGLADVVGGAIVVPATAFTTQSTQPPNANIEALVFSFPNEQGEVILNGPPGTLEVGSTILIVNESTGEVSTLGVNNDGSVSDVGGRFIAYISDRLIVTITDPQGRTTTFKRSEYVAEDGTTAVGNGGGEIVGDGGVEVRIPEDAVMQGVAAILKIAAISLEQLPEGALPDLPGATVSTALQIDVPEQADPPAFQKEVDLVFPKPADAPEDAVYIVYRRMDGPDGSVAYEAIDYAEVEGDKVVTASNPWPGYVSSVNGYSASGVDFGGAVSNQFTNYAILMYLYDVANPTRTLGGAITGKVLRATFDPDTGAPAFEPVVGALVSGVDASNQPLYTSVGGEPVTVAVSQKDGTYTLFDRRFIGGSVTVSANVEGVVRTATAYEVAPQNVSGTGLRFAKAIATANITFPALPPSGPPSPVQVSVLTLDPDGSRRSSNGIVVAGDPVVIGIRAADNTVQRVEIRSGSQTVEYGVRVDPANDYTVIVDSSSPFATPGSYTITASALSPFGGVVSGYTIVRAVVAGGGNDDPLPNDPPKVITARTVPKAAATGVQIGALPQIAFTEPVQNVPDGVSLREEGGDGVAILISGVGPNGPIANVTPLSVVTSITIQPVSGLEFGKKYTLSLSSAIVDTDTGANPKKPLEPYETTFSTFLPEAIGQTEELFTAGGMAVIGDRAYVATPQNLGRYFTSLRLFDVSDPTTPLEIAGAEPGGSGIMRPPPAFWLGLPVDVVASEVSPLTGGPVVAVATSSLTYPYHSSNVRLFDVSNEQQWRWMGAVSLGRDPSDGMIRRIEMKDSMLYAVTAGIGKGIQFVDLNIVADAFTAAVPDGVETAAYWQMQGQLNSTEGFLPEAIVSTVNVDTGTGDNSQLWDLSVIDLVMNSLTQPVVVATGRSPLAIASYADGLLYNGPITDGFGGPAVTGWGYGVTTGVVNGMPIAFVSAMGTGGALSASHVLAIVDLANPRTPRYWSLLPLPGSAGAVQDLVLRGTTLFIGMSTGTLIVNVADHMSPRLLGEIPSVNGRLGFTSDSIMIGTRRGLTEVTSAQGGIRSAALAGPLLIIPRIPGQMTRDVETPGDPGQPQSEEFIDDVPVRVIAVGGPAAGGQLTFFESGVALLQRAVGFVGSVATVVIPGGTRFIKGARLSVIAGASVADEPTLSPEAYIPAGTFEILLDSNNDAKLGLRGSAEETADRQAAREGKAFAFWTSESNEISEDALTDFARLIVRRNVTIDSRTKVGVRIEGSDWELKRQVQLGKDYSEGAVPADSGCRQDGVLTFGDRLQLCWPKAATRQLSLLKETRPAYAPTSAGNAVFQVPAILLDRIDNRFIFRCLPGRGCKAPKIEIGQIRADGTFVSGHTAKIDVRSVKQWMTAKRARTAATTEQVRTTPLSAADATIEGWSSDAPARVEETDQVTVLVHGFLVPESSALTGTFPKLFKRLYWAGHRVFAPQKAHTIGIAWPGGSGFDALLFNVQEMHAFQTGGLLADYLSEIKNGPSRPRLRIVAHSLGTLVANTAVRYATDIQQTDTLSMVDGALAREAFYGPAEDVQYVPAEAKLFLGETSVPPLVTLPSLPVTKLGYPNDQHWVDLYNDPDIDDQERLRADWGFEVDFFGLPLGAVEKLYVRRWTRVPGKTPWHGIFFTNPTRLSVWNYHNHADDALKLGPLDPWWRAQVVEKPATVLPDQKGLFWAKLRDLSADDIAQWRADHSLTYNPLAEDTPLDATAIKRRNRRWAELAHYFRALSRPIGIGEIGSENMAGKDVDVHDLGGSTSFDSHTFLTGKPLSEVWRLFTHIASVQ